MSTMVVRTALTFTGQATSSERFHGEIDGETTFL